MGGRCVRSRIIGADSLEHSCDLYMGPLLTAANLAEAQAHCTSLCTGTLRKPNLNPTGRGPPQRRWTKISRIKSFRIRWYSDVGALSKDMRWCSERCNGTCKLPHARQTSVFRSVMDKGLPKSIYTFTAAFARLLVSIRSPSRGSGGAGGIGAQMRDDDRTCQAALICTDLHAITRAAGHTRHTSPAAS